MVSESTHLYRDTLKLYGKQSKERVIKCFQNANETKKKPQAVAGVFTYQHQKKKNHQTFFFLNEHSQYS